MATVEKLTAIGELRERLAGDDWREMLPRYESLVAGALVELSDELREMHARQKKANSLLGMISGRLRK